MAAREPDLQDSGNMARVDDAVGQIEKDYLEFSGGAWLQNGRAASEPGVH
jgi:hypothetical protein